MSASMFPQRSYLTRIARATRAYVRVRMGRHARIAVLTVASMGLLTGVAFNIARPAQTDAATSNVINFQARLETAGGAIVPDGNYNIEFKLYNTASGGSALWTEDYLNSASKGVEVSNGYVTVNLGSVNAFPGTINWDQQLWLTMNIGGSTSSASWDGEMNPRLQLTALPYAFQSNSAHQLQQTQGSYAGTLSFGSLTANRGISLPDENGTLCIQNSANCGFASATALNGYVQLQTGSPGTQQTGNFNISGNGILGGTLGVTGNTTLGGLTTLNTLGTTDTSSLLCLNSSKQVAACSSGTGAAFVQGGNGFGATGVLGTTDNYGLNIQTHGITALSLDASQNATFAGNVTVGSVLGVNTTSNTVQIGSATANATGANLVLNNYNGVSEPAGVDGAMYYNATLKQFRCYQNGGWVNCAGEGGNGVNTVGALNGQTKSANGAVISGSDIYLQTADQTNPGLVSAAAQTFGGAKTFANDSTAALQVQNAAGTTTVLGVDTTGNNVNFDSATKLVWGGNTNLYQSATNVLQTDDSLTVGTNLSVTGTSSLTGNTTVGGTLGVTGAVTGGTYNSQTISSAANFTGTLAVATSVSTPLLNVISGSYDVGIGSDAQTGNVSLTIPIVASGSDEICLKTLGNCNATGSSFIVNGTGLQTNANFNIQSASTGSVTAQIRALSGQTADLLDLALNADTGVRVAVNSSGKLVLGNGFGSTAALSYGNLGIVDSGRMSVGNVDLTGNAVLGISTGTANVVAQIIRGASGQTADLLQLQNSSGTVLSHFDASGNLAIGSASAPGYPLDVTGNVNTSTGYLIGGQNINSAGVLNNVAYLNQANTFTQPQIVNATSSATSGSVIGSALHLSVTPSSTSTTSFYASQSNTTYNGTASNTGLVIGAINQAGQAAGSGVNVGYLYGSLNQAYVSGAGTVNAAVGANGLTNIQATATGSIASAVGVRAQVSNNSTAGGSITNAYGLEVMTPIASATGTIGTDYGVYIQSQAGTGITTAYGLYQAGSGDLNVLNGATSINNTLGVSGAASFTAVGTGLSVTNNATIGGTLGVTGATTLTGQLNANGGIVTNNTNINTGTGTVNGATITSTTFNTAVISGGSLSSNTVNNLGLTSTAITSTGALAVTGGTTLSLQSTGANAVTLDSGTTGAVNIGTGANAKTVTVGNTTGATSVVLQSGTGGINLSPSGASNTGVTITPGTDSTAAFQIQYAGGASSLFTADTVNSQLIVNNSATLKVQNIDSSGSTATITRTNRVAAASSTSPYGTGSYSPSSTFTPSAGNVLIAYVDVESNNQVMATDGSDITISGGSLTWVPITGKIQRSAGWGIGFRAFYAVVPSTPPANMQVTVDAGSVNISKYEVTVDEMGGVNTSSPVAGAVTGGRQSTSSNTWTATLSASPATADWKILMGSIDQDNATHIWNTPSGWTENSSPASLRPSPDSTVMYQTGSTTTTLNYTLGSVQYSGADTAYGGFILKAASGSSINFGTGAAGSINIGNSASQTTLSGSTLLKNTSTTAFQVQNALGGTSVLDVDTTNSRVGVGTAAPAYALDVQGGSGIVGQFSGRVIGANAVNSNEFTTLGQVTSLISGSGGNYILNQTGLQASSNFHISGTGTADTSLSTPLVTSTSALSITGGTSLTLQSTSTNAVTLDSGTTGAVNIGTGANAKAITIGNTTTGTTVALQGPAVNVNQLTGTNTINLGSAVGSAATQTINIGASSTASSTTNVTVGSTIGSSTTTIQGGTGGIKLTPNGTSNTGVLVKPTNASTGAFQVQNTSSYSVFGVDTTNGQAVLGSASNLNGTLTFANSAGSNTVGLALADNPNNSYTLLLPTSAPAGGQCIKTGLSNPNQLVFGSCITPTTPQFVQQATNSNSSNGSSLATTISTSSAGDLLIAQIAVNTGSAVVTSVTDSAGNTWVKATSGAGGSLDSEIWYAVDASPANSVTVNVSGSRRIAVNISEFDGVAQSSVLDVSNGQYDGGGNTHTTPSITTTVDHDLVLASLSWASGPSMTGNGSGWNDMTAVTATPDMSSRFMVGSPAGAFSTSWTSSFYTTSASSIVAFKPAGDGSDYAEDYGTTDASIMAGDVVALDQSKPAMQAINRYGQVDSKAWIVKASSSDPADAIGVVSTSPGQVIGKAIFSTGDNPRSVALSGRVPVKVSDENGPVKLGDYLVPSSTPGVAMKAVSPGMVIGQALSGFDGPGQGTVTAFIKNTYYPGDTGSSGSAQNGNNGSSNSNYLYLQNGSSATLQSLAVTDLTTVSDLQATGTVTTGSLVATTTTSDNVTATNTTTDALSVGGNANVGNLVANGTITTNNLQVNGSALFRDSTNTTNAFQIQNSGSTPLFTVDTQNSRVYVGNPTPDATGALLVLDNKNTNGDPDGVNGGMYYNAATGKFRCYQNGGWRDCLSPWIQITKSSDQDVTNSATYANDNDLQFNVTAGKVYTVRFNVCYAGNSSSGNYKGEFTFPAAIAAKNVSGRYVGTAVGDSAVASAGTLGGTTTFPNNGLSMGTADAFSDKRVFEGDFTFQPNADGMMHYMFAQNTATDSTAARTCANSFIEYQAL